MSEKITETGMRHDFKVRYLKWLIIGGAVLFTCTIIIIALWSLTSQGMGLFMSDDVKVRKLNQCTEDLERTRSRLEGKEEELAKIKAELKAENEKGLLRHLY